MMDRLTGNVEVVRLVRAEILLNKGHG